MRQAVQRLMQRLSREGLRLSLLLVWGLPWARPLPLSISDQVTLPTLPDPSAAIVVVRGGTEAAAGPCLYDRLRKGRSVLEIGQVVPKVGCASDVLLFAKSGAMGINPVTWTTGADAVTLAAPGSPVTVEYSFVMVDKDRQAAQLAGRDTIQAIARFNENRTGLSFRTSRIVAPKELNNSEIATIGNRCDRDALTALSTKPKLYDPRRINVYFVPGLLGYRGRNCFPEGFPNVIYISTSGDSPATLAHEFGHALGLQDWPPRKLGHTGALSTQHIGGFMYLNIMWTGLYDAQANEQRHLSIGQGYRMNMDTSSWLIRTGIVPGRKGLACHPNKAEDSIPCLLLALDTVPTP
jgi:hypothetical protein